MHATVPIILACVVLSQPSSPLNAATLPAHRAESSDWMERHEWLSEAITKTRPRLLFAGDSIVMGWNTFGQDVWEREYSAYNAVNIGIGGDRTQHLLWRLENTDITGSGIELAVVNIGTNNLGENTPEETGAGILAVVDCIINRSPDTRVLLLGLFPRVDDGPEIAADRDRVNEILAQTEFPDRVEYRDISGCFLTANGNLDPDVTIDLVHPSAEGYRRWADAIRHDVRRLLEEPPVAGDSRRDAEAAPGGN